MLHLPLILAVVAQILLLWVPAQASDITCKTGVLSNLAGVFLTCHFQEDISKTRRNFNVYHYPFNDIGEADSQNANEIILCNWVSDKDELKCEKKPGFYFDYNVSDHLTLGFPLVTSAVAGQYVCQLVPDQSDNVIPCNLYVLDHSLYTQEDKICSSCCSDDVQQDEYEQPQITEGISYSTSGTGVIVLSIAVSILFFLVVVGLITYFRTRFVRLFRGKSSPPMLPDPYAADKLCPFPPEENHEAQVVNVDSPDYEQSRLLQPPTESGDSTGTPDLAAYTLPNKTTKVVTPLTEGLDQKGAGSSPGDLTKRKKRDYETILINAQPSEKDLSLPTRLEDSSEREDNRLSQLPDPYEKVVPEEVASDEEHNHLTFTKQKVVMAWTTEDLCRFLKREGGIKDVVIEAFEKGKVTGADFDTFDYRNSLKGSDVDNYHLKRLGSLLDDLKVTRNKQFLDRPGNVRTEVIMV